MCPQHLKKLFSFTQNLLFCVIIHFSLIKISNVFNTLLLGGGARFHYKFSPNFTDDTIKGHDIDNS